MDFIPINSHLLAYYDRGLSNNKPLSLWIAESGTNPASVDFSVHFVMPGNLQWFGAHGSHSRQQGRTSLCPRGAAGRRGCDSSGSGPLYTIPLQSYPMFIRNDHKAIWPSKCNTNLGVLAEWVLVNSVSFPTLCLGERIVRRLVLLCWRDDRLDNFSMEHFQSLTMNGTSFLRGEKNRHRFSNASAGCKKMCWLAIFIFDLGWLGHGRSQFNFYPCNISLVWPYCTLSFLCAWILPLSP